MKRSERSNLCAVFAVGILSLPFLSMPGPASATAQDLTGRWVAIGKPLENGDEDKSIFELKQNEGKLTGSIQFPGWSTKVKGVVVGTHFELFGADENDNHPFLTGDLSNGEIQGFEWGKPIRGRLATPADEFTNPPYMNPPPLHLVPYNGLAKAPPMGWNSWNLFADKVDDQTVRTIADAMVSSGMRDAGYVYVNIDDTWEGVRDSHGNLTSNHKFPDMRALADYVHSKGLKLGIYSSPGPRTCGGYPASYGHEEQDARTFAAWGVDYLKYDWCSASFIYANDKLQQIYQRMGDALRSTGRPIVFSLCEYGMGSVEKWGPAVGGNLWRTTGDIRDEWDSMLLNIHTEVATAPFAGPGHWNDPDMLEIGNGHMSDVEYRTHLSLWALTAAPLLAGNDVRNMPKATKSILLNKEVIAIDQDPLGKQATPMNNGEMEIWVKPLADGGVAVGVVNASPTTGSVTIKLKDFDLDGKVKKARDLWAHQDVLFKDGAYPATLPAHGVLMLRLSKQRRQSEGPKSSRLVRFLRK